MIHALIALAAAAQAAPTPAPAPDTVAAPDYRQDSAWLCLPGRADDACSTLLPTVALNPNGYGSVGRSGAADAVQADCFYVYPTVSRDAGITSDLMPGIEEQAAAYTQAARFGEQCRVFAPVYRQLTLAALARSQNGENQAEIGRAFGLAYEDIKAAWAEFLRRSGDRPFVLLGHSQGSIHLVQLLAEEIEGKPVAARMLSAMLLGWNVEVPTGELVGGSFRTTPLCTAAGQTGCVVTYVSFRQDAPPPEDALFGRAVVAGRTVACTNPAGLGSDAAATLDSYWFAGRPTSPPIQWSSAGAPAVPFVRTEGLVTAQCVHDGGVGYLALSVEPTPDDARTDAIPGDVVVGGQRLAGWGMHLADVPVAQGDLIRLVQRQSAEWVANSLEAQADAYDAQADALESQVEKPR